MTFGSRVPALRYGTKLRWDGVTFFLSFSDGPYERGGIILPSPIFLPPPLSPGHSVPLHQSRLLHLPSASRRL